MALLPNDYLERVYAGVLGKLIGVYLGRPFEGWTHQRVMEVLGPIHYYVHDHPKVPAFPWDPSSTSNKGDMPLVVTDDDVSGTFTFVRALEEHGFSPDITSQQIGKTWLNQIIEGQTVLWWGGRGVSTEHTAYLNLKNGIPAPDSGSVATNGKTMAEQIGAQIFIDGWAMVAPGNPRLAARLAQQAASVSHDGESVYAAMLWAAMEAEAFLTKHVDYLLDTGLSVIPATSAIAGLIMDVRQWHASDGDWLKTRQRIEDKYGYDKYYGVCHVMPNHGVMVMALLYAGDDFTEAMHIINTCGWDTDCNSGNVGCLVALIHGMAAFQGSTDWRGPMADRALISSADGGFSITTAASIALEVTNIGRRIAGLEPLEAPKGGAQFHFTLPGSIQGFTTKGATLAHEYDELARGVLVIECPDLKPSSETVEVLTQVFTGKDVLKMHTYPLMASPLIYPGQTVEAKVRLPATNMAEIQLALRLKVYGPEDTLITRDSAPIILGPDKEAVIKWTIPDEFDSQPIQSVGLALNAVENDFTGKVIIDSLGWTGVPSMILKRPSDRSSQFWKRAWVNGVDASHTWMKPSFCIVNNRGEGILIHGTREWTDYRAIVTGFTVQLGQPAGVAIRVRGLNRYYAIMFSGHGKTVTLVKALDEQRIVMASGDLSWELDHSYEVAIQAEGPRIIGRVVGTDIELTAEDDQYIGGGLGLIVTDGTVSADQIDIRPVS